MNFIHTGTSVNCWKIQTCCILYDMECMWEVIRTLATSKGADASPQPKQTKPVPTMRVQVFQIWVFSLKFGNIYKLFFFQSLFILIGHVWKVWPPYPLVRGESELWGWPQGGGLEEESVLGPYGPRDGLFRVQIESGLMLILNLFIDHIMWNIFDKMHPQVCIYQRWSGFHFKHSVFSTSKQFQI